MAANFHADLKLRRILFATDFSASALAALPQAARLARISGARLYLANVIQVHPWKVSNEATLRLRIDATRRLDHLLALPELREISAQTLVGLGEVTAEILRLAQDHAAGLVVTGTRSCHGLNHFFGHSAAEQLAESAPCPVLAVGPVLEPWPSTSHSATLSWPPA